MALYRNQAKIDHLDAEYRRLQDIANQAYEAARDAWAASLAAREAEIEEDDRSLEAVR